jgi:hypothetical protein
MSEVNENDIMAIEDLAGKGIVAILILKSMVNELPPEFLAGPISAFEKIATLVGCDINRLYCTAKKEIFEVINTSPFDDNIKNEMKETIEKILDSLSPEQRVKISEKGKKLEEAARQFEEAVARIGKPK